MKFAQEILNMNANATRNYATNGSAFSVQFAWSGVTGTPNGTIVVSGYNGDSSQGSVLQTINVNSASNFADVDCIAVAYPFEFIRIVYTKNSITGGSLQINGSIV